MCKITGFRRTIDWFDELQMNLGKEINLGIKLRQLVHCHGKYS